MTTDAPVREPEHGSGPDEQSTRVTRTFQPQADIWENKHDFVIHLNMPGATEETVELTLERDLLTVHAAVAPPVFPGFPAVCLNYAIGNWKRSFRLSEAIDHALVAADITDGVLTIRLPKAKQAVRQKIEVQRK